MPATLPTRPASLLLAGLATVGATVPGLARAIDDMAPRHFVTDADPGRGASTAPAGAGAGAPGVLLAQAQVDPGTVTRSSAVRSPPPATRDSTHPAPAPPLPLALPARAGDRPLLNPAPAAPNAPANSDTTTPPTASPVATVVPAATPNTAPVLETPRRVQLGCSLRDYGAPVARGQVAAAVFNTCSGVSLHKPMFLTVGLSPEYNGKQSEVVFQLSGKGQIWDFGPTKLYGAYTQESFFQFFDSARSKYFRETVYNPELFFRTPTPFPQALPDVSFDAGFEHQSNGQDLPDSRSFNRLYIEPYYTRGRQAMSLRVWYRLPEDESRARTDPKRDDNPDINRYLGYAEFHYRRDFDWRASLVDVGVRFNPASGRGALQADYSFQAGQTAAVFFRGFTGFGESLIDYNHWVTRATVGVALQR